MSEFFFIRHGETDWNIQGLMQGATDIPLNDTGRAQARAARAFIRDANISRLVASPMSRALETAQLLNEGINLPLITDTRLAERSFGIYEGRHRSEAPYENGHIADGAPHEKIEPFAAVALRARTAIEEALQVHNGERIAFIAHGAVFSALHDFYLGNRRGCDNAVPYHFRRTADQWDIVEFAMMSSAA